MIEALEKKWTCDLPDFTFFIKKLDELFIDFDPTRYSGSEMYIKQMVRMAKQLKKRKLTKKTKKFTNSKTTMLVNDSFLLSFFL